MDGKMFCYQCQETAAGKGCTIKGVCGKTSDVAAMQDLLIYVSKGLSAIATAIRKEGKCVPAKVNHLITSNMFTTITNANFNIESIKNRIQTTLDMKEQLLQQLDNKTQLPDAAFWSGKDDWETKSKMIGVLSTKDEDIRSLRELITYGIKGLSAYTKHANVLLQDDEEVLLFSMRLPQR